MNSTTKKDLDGNAAGAKEYLHYLLTMMMERGASDLHLCAGVAPSIRVSGVLASTQEFPAMTAELIRDMLWSVLDDAQKDKLTSDLELDFSYSLPGVSRFRGNVLFHRHTMGCVFRSIPARPYSLSELGLPQVVLDLCRKPRGLVLVTGPTGSGKSTTLAAMIDYINEHSQLHIVTMEDPIEFIHRNKRSFVRQREVETDTRSFPAALKHVLRQDPDVIMVGELRDLETVSLAVTAAETGHLVLATLHTTGAAHSIDRIIDVFPPHQQSQIRLQLSMTLEGIISQTLVPRSDQPGRVLVAEILVGSPAVRNLIREAKTHQVHTVMSSSASLGMQTFEMALKALYEAGVVALEDALAVCSDPDEFLRLLGQYRR
ncbi:MAG: type IV pilus twitching motility protein PilT [Candidatus Xenobia bacterium]